MTKFWHGGNLGLVFELMQIVMFDLIELDCSSMIFFSYSMRLINSKSHEEALPRHGGSENILNFNLYLRFDQMQLI